MATMEDERMSQEAVAGAGTAPRVPLGQLLIAGGFLTQAQLDDALFEGSRTGDRLGEVVVRKGLASEDDIARLLAEQWGLEYVDRSSIWFDADALTRLSREDAQRLEALPTRVEGGRVVVAVAEPTEQRLEALRGLIGADTVMIVVPKSALDAGLRSDLLRSSWGPGSAQPAAADAAPTAPEPEVEPEPAPPPPRPVAVAPPPPEPEPERAPLAPVMPLPIHRPEVDVDEDDAAALLVEAQAVAERLAGQAAAVRAQQHEARQRTEQYELRIRELEQHLVERTEQLNRLRGQLHDLLASFD
jgi:Type II secretion system (T2SS), protein E, N-terminal domain